jgi:hypothetical protein
MSDKRDHEWIEVGLRRWCMTCDAYQMKTNHSGDWKGWAGMFCPRTTPYAMRCDGVSTQKAVDHV